LTAEAGGDPVDRREGKYGRTAINKEKKENGLLRKQKKGETWAEYSD